MGKKVKGIWEKLYNQKEIVQNVLHEENVESINTYKNADDQQYNPTGTENLWGAFACLGIWLFCFKAGLKQPRLAGNS